MVELVTTDLLSPNSQVGPSIGVAVCFGVCVLLLFLVQDTHSFLYILRLQKSLGLLFDSFLHCHGLARGGRIRRHGALGRIQQRL
jgi:hypothetical protein